MSTLGGCTSAEVTFADMSTFSEMESFLYGGPYAVTQFVGAVTKGNWFSHVPITLRSQGTVDFGQRKVSYVLNRSADYICAVWFRTRIPFITSTVGAVRWTRKLMHNMIDTCKIKFNELLVQEFDSYWLDFHQELRVTASKYVGYQNMIADTTAFYGVSTSAGPTPGNTKGDGGFHSVVLPFWFGEDSGLALPIAATPHNEVTIEFSFRRWQNLVVVSGGATIASVAAAESNVAYTVATAPTPAQVGQVPVLTAQDIQFIEPELYAHYAMVHNDERLKMGDAPRDILIKQVQTVQKVPISGQQVTQDLRLSHAIINIVWAYQNTTLLDANADGGGEWSNYHCLQNYQNVADPIAFSRLTYENSQRFREGSDYFNLILPYLLTDVVPVASQGTGYIHLWSYSTRPWACLGGYGSTNFNKLANVSLQHVHSPAAITALGAGETFRHAAYAQNHNVIRLANGSVGQPIL